MKTKYIKMTELSDTLQIIRLALHIDGDVIASKGRYSVDCKSILGVLSLNFGMGVKIEYPETAHELDEFVSQFEIEVANES